MKQILTVTGLRNRYFGQRHGKSHANALKTILSDPERGKQKRYGLTQLGRFEARDAAKDASKLFRQNLIVVTSNFSRAEETAAITAKIMGAKVLPYNRLRERNFGIWEGTTISNYKKVWGEDQKNPDYRNHHGESVNDVLKRLLEVIAELESTYIDTDILLVSHGDPLQILQCFFQGLDPRNHRDVPHFKTAEIRQLSPL